MGSYVMTPEGRAKVIGHEILTCQLLVVTEDRRRVLVDVADASLVPSDQEKKEGEPNRASKS